MSARILLLHGLLDGSRQTNIDYSLALARYPHGHEVHVGNILAPLDSSIKNTRFDALVITYEVAAMRTLPMWPWIVQRITQLRKLSDKFAIFVQDDYTFSKPIDELACRLEAAAIFSPLSEYSDLLYPKSLQQGIPIEPVLTGYVDTDKATFWKANAKPLSGRPLDLGQRITFLPPEWGKGGQTKALVAYSLAEIATARGFQVDVQSSADSILTGNAWLEFLAKCRFTVGARGGSSRIDYAGVGARSDARKRILRRLKLSLRSRQPHKFVRTGDFRAIGPRVFEAAITGTCQILVRDSYLPEMQPWEHYIPVAPDLSDVDLVLDAMSDLDRCSEIVDNARRSLVDESPRYHYETMVLLTLHALGLAPVAAQDQGEVIDLVSSLRSFLELPESVRFKLRKAQAHHAAKRVRATGSTRDTQNDSGTDLGTWVEAIAWPWCAPLPDSPGGSPRDSGKVTP